MDNQDHISLTTKNSFYYIEDAVAQRSLYKNTDANIHEGNYKKYEEKRCLILFLNKTL